MVLGESGVCGVNRLKSLPADMTACRGVVGGTDRASRCRGVEGVTGLCFVDTCEGDLRVRGGSSANTSSSSSSIREYAGSSFSSLYETVFARRRLRLGGVATGQGISKNNQVSNCKMGATACSFRRGDSPVSSMPRALFPKAARGMAVIVPSDLCR